MNNNSFLKTLIVGAIGGMIGYKVMEEIKIKKSLWDLEMQDDYEDDYDDYDYDEDEDDDNDEMPF